LKVSIAELMSGQTPLGVVDGILNYDAVRFAEGIGAGDVEGTVCMVNNWLTTIVAWLVWLAVTIFNIATLTFLGLGIGTSEWIGITRRNSCWIW
jgi:metal iron transporter